MVCCLFAFSALPAADQRQEKRSLFPHHPVQHWKPTGPPAAAPDFREGRRQHLCEPVPGWLELFSRSIAHPLRNLILYLQKDRVPNAFNSDVVKRAQQYIDSVPSAGAYTDSAGIRAVREEVADFLLQRDGHASDPDSIFLTSGASDSVRFCMQTILRTPESGFRDAILTPIPQYPLYSALTTLLQGNLAPYYLDESQGWACTVDNLTASLNAATEKGHVTKALVVINPGNPTGQVLSESNIRDIISWCREKGIMLLADEVYQENVYKEGARFVSFRKVKCIQFYYPCLLLLSSTCDLRLPTT